MALRQLLVSGMATLLATSCATKAWWEASESGATKALWQATDPLEYVSVPQGDVSEAELRERGVDYRKDDEHGVYYVEKSGLRRLGDYSIRFFLTPVTVVVDVAPAIVVVGAVAGALYLDGRSRSGWR